MYMCVGVRGGLGERGGVKRGLARLKFNCKICV